MSRPPTWIPMESYRQVSEWYGDVENPKTNRPYRHRVDEGLVILDSLLQDFDASERTREILFDAWCLLPMQRSGRDLQKVLGGDLIAVMGSKSAKKKLMAVTRLTRSASSHYTVFPDALRPTMMKNRLQGNLARGRFWDVRLILIAGKIQALKELSLWKQDAATAQERLQARENLLKWFKVLEVDEEQREKLLKLIEAPVGKPITPTKHLVHEPIPNTNLWNLMCVEGEKQTVISASPLRDLLFIAGTMCRGGEGVTGTLEYEAHDDKHLKLNGSIYGELPVNSIVLPTSVVEEWALRFLEAHSKGQLEHASTRTVQTLSGEVDLKHSQKVWD